MSNLSPFSQKIAPLSIGYVIHATLRLYRDIFLTYFQLIIRAFLWSIAPITPFLILFILSFILPAIIVPSFSTSHINSSDLTSILFGLFGIFIISLIPSIPLLIVFSFYCTAKFYKNYALVSRMAYRLLINQPERLEEVAYKVSELWIFLWVNLLINVIFAIVQPFDNGITDALKQAAIDKGTFVDIAINILLLIQTFLYFWLMARFYLCDVILAVESTTGINAINRSWQLTKGFSIKILLVILASFLVILPAYLIAGIPFFLFIISIYKLGLAPISSPENTWIINNIMLLIASSVALFVVWFLSLPYWQILKAVIYYDLHSRRS